MPPTKDNLPSDSNSPPRPNINPSALTIDELARVLSSAAPAQDRQTVTPEDIKADIDSGAPAFLGPPGSDAKPRLNLIHYTAWLLQKIRGQQT